jgi:hypothetical protein
MQCTSACARIAGRPCEALFAFCFTTGGRDGEQRGGMALLLLRVRVPAQARLAGLLSDPLEKGVAHRTLQRRVWMWAAGGTRGAAGGRAGAAVDAARRGLTSRCTLSASVLSSGALATAWTARESGGMAPLASGSSTSRWSAGSRSWARTIAATAGSPPRASAARKIESSSCCSSGDVCPHTVCEATSVAVTIAARHAVTRCCASALAAISWGVALGGSTRLARSWRASASSRTRASSSNIAKGLTTVPR